MSEPPIIAVVGARLSSSRLPAKHLLDLAGKPLILRVLERLQQVPELDQVWVATTQEPSNQPLIEELNNHQVKVFAYPGPTADLVGRVASLVDQIQPKIVVYVCGDSGLIEPKTLSRLIQAALTQPDHLPRLALPPSGTVWVHEGFDVYSQTLFAQMVKQSTNESEREHLGSSLKKNPPPIAEVPEPQCFAVAQKPRLSVDTQADYQVYQALYQDWYQTHPPNSIVDLKWALTQWQENPALQATNQHVQQRSATRRPAQYQLVCALGPEIGLGHLSRCLQLARALQEYCAAGTQLEILGDAIAHPALRFHNHRFHSNRESLIQSLTPHPLILDWPKQIPALALPHSGFRVLVDPTRNDPADFWVRPSIMDVDGPRQIGGLHALILNPDIRPADRPEHLLVLTGGSDALNLGRSLPALLENWPTPIDWVQGPLAPEPQIETGLNVRIWHNPDMKTLYAQARWAITPFGISFWECLQARIPTLVIADPGKPHEMAKLEALQGCLISKSSQDLQDQVQALQGFSTRPNLPELDGRGAQRVARAIHQAYEAQS
ncbi:MAG: NTP transferase domain-containing protein [Acidobacteria bacterium]|nr:NTP transferase domain-containing protein [Acidobacteriota bacterium]